MNSKILKVKLNRDYPFSELEDYLSRGWHVVAATPIINSTSNGNTYTEQIIYILEELI